MGAVAPPHAAMITNGMPPASATASSQPGRVGINVANSASLSTRFPSVAAPRGSLKCVPTVNVPTCDRSAWPARSVVVPSGPGR